MASEDFLTSHCIEARREKKFRKINRTICLSGIALIAIDFTGVAANIIQRHNCITALYREAATSPNISLEYKQRLTGFAEELGGDKNYLTLDLGAPFHNFVTKAYDFEPRTR